MAMSLPMPMDPVIFHADRPFLFYLQSGPISFFSGAMRDGTALLSKS